jgi:hypothetical protein
MSTSRGGPVCDLVRSWRGRAVLRWPRLHVCIARLLHSFLGRQNDGISMGPLPSVQPYPVPRAIGWHVAANKNPYV